MKKVNLGLAKSVLAIALASLCATNSAQAAVVYDNGAPTRLNGYAISGTIGLGTGPTSADDFSFASNTTVKSVGFYFNNYNGISGWDGNVSYGIYSDAGGALGSLLKSGTGLNVQAVSGGYAWCCGSQNSEFITFDLQAEFVASAGMTYWLELGGAGGPTPWWVTAGSGNGKTYGSDIGEDLAFVLMDTLTTSNAVPEPTTLALLGFGLAGIGFGRRRTKK